MDEMDDLLNYGVENLGDMLKGNSHTKIAFKLIADAIEDISEVINEKNKGTLISAIREFDMIVPQ